MAVCTELQAVPDPQADGGGYLGAAVLGLRISNAQNIFVSWRGGTMTPNERVYAVRLQYRVGATNTLRDVFDAFGRGRIEARG